MDKSEIIQKLKDATNIIKDHNKLLSKLEEIIQDLNKRYNITEDIFIVIFTFLCVAMMLGGIDMYKSKDSIHIDNTKNEKTKIIENLSQDDKNEEISPNEPLEQTEKHTEVVQPESIFKNKVILSDTYNPQDTDFSTRFTNENWPHIVTGLVELETWFDTDKVTEPADGERCAYGPGLTYVYTKDAKGKIHQHECKGEYVEMVRKMSDADVWFNVKQHVRYTMMQISLESTNPEHTITEMSAQQLLALLFVAYQTPGHISTIIDNIYNATNDLETAQAFMHYIAKDEDKNGTLKRRWWCALYYLGKINTLDFLSLKADGFANRGYDIFNEIVSPDGKTIKTFALDDDTITTALNQAKKFHKKDVDKLIKNSPALKSVWIKLQQYKTQIEKQQKQQNKNTLPVYPNNQR